MAVIASAALYEALKALEVVGQGSEPGEGAPAGGAVGVVVGLALAIGAVVTVSLASTGERVPWVAALLAPAAGAFLIAHVYTPDPYYIPTIRRYVDAGPVPASAAFALAAGALGAGALTLLRRRTGLLLSAPLIVACGVAAWWSALGH